MVYVEPTNPSIFELKKLIVIDEINKPLKAISNYKITELVSDKLKIPNKILKLLKLYKKELYLF